MQKNLIGEKSGCNPRVSEEVGYGIVPADAFERQYREAVGRVCTELAGKSQQGYKSCMWDRDGAEKCLTLYLIRHGHDSGK